MILWNHSNTNQSALSESGYVQGLIEQSDYYCTGKGIVLN